MKMYKNARIGRAQQPKAMTPNKCHRRDGCPPCFYPPPSARFAGTPPWLIIICSICPTCLGMCCSRCLSVYVWLDSKWRFYIEPAKYIYRSFFDGSNGSTDRMMRMSRSFIESRCISYLQHYFALVYNRKA